MIRGVFSARRQIGFRVDCENQGVHHCLKGQSSFGGIPADFVAGAGKKSTDREERRREGRGEQEQQGRGWAGFDLAISLTNANFILLCRTPSKI